MADHHRRSPNPHFQRVFPIGFYGGGQSACSEAGRSMNKLKREKGKEKKGRNHELCWPMHGKKKRKITGESAAEGVRYSRGTKLRAARPLFSFVRDRNMHARIALIIACPLDSNRLNIFFIIKLVSLSLSIFLASNTTAIVKSGALRMRNYSFEPSKARKK